MGENCTCGHVWDEHEYGGGDCTIDDCPCFAFEDQDDEGGEN